MKIDALFGTEKIIVHSQLTFQPEIVSRFFECKRIPCSFARPQPGTENRRRKETEQKSEGEVEEGKKELIMNKSDSSECFSLRCHGKLAFCLGEDVCQRKNH